MSKVDVSHSRCIACAGCVGVCPVDAITLNEIVLAIDSSPCISCGLCIQFCPVGALEEGAEYGAPPTRRVSRVVVVDV
ncbi:MAG: 4Fe-4S binding protein [Thermoplasmatota archaeon]